MTFLRQAHPDNRNRDTACAWLAILVHRDASLGTYADAREYWGESTRASAREKYLYGAEKKKIVPPVIALARGRFPAADGGDGGREAEVRAMARRAMDAVTELGIDPEALGLGFTRMETLEAARGKFGGKFGSRCLRCGKHGGNGGGGGDETGDETCTKLRRCAGCSSVYYCSDECQRIDRPNHKQQCKQRRAEQNKAHAGEGTNSRGTTAATMDEIVYGVREASLGVGSVGSATKDDEETKARVARNKATDKWVLKMRACARAEARLKANVEAHGAQLAAWWHHMVPSARRKLLRNLTNDTIPEDVRAPGASLTRKALHLPEVALLKYCQATLCDAPCGCCGDEASASGRAPSTISRTGFCTRCGAER